jgi:protein TonB
MTSSAALSGTAARPAGALRQGGFAPASVAPVGGDRRRGRPARPAGVSPGRFGGEPTDERGTRDGGSRRAVSQAVAPPPSSRHRGAVAHRTGSRGRAGCRRHAGTAAGARAAKATSGRAATGALTARRPHRRAVRRPAPTQRSLAAAPDYALGATLNPGPRPLDEIEPDYPDVHLREGVVVLRLLIGATGHVDDVAVVRSAPEGVFEQAALDAFGKARFAPGLAGGTPVKSQITVEVQFMPINRGARISGRTY